MKRLLFIFFIFQIPLFSYSQPIDGSTGLMKIPSADMQKDGTFIVGANYLPDAITSYKHFDYNTGNYFFNLTFLPFLEFTYRSTLLKWEDNLNQDRSFGLRVRVIKESKLIPSLVIGGNDLYTTGQEMEIIYKGTSNRFFNSTFVVATKHLDVADNRIGFTVGISNGGVRKQNLNGIFGGISYIPAFLPNLRLMAEYDADVISTGADLLLWKHLSLFVMAYDLKYIAGGFSYRFCLKNQAD